jgi:urease accessory protein
MNRGLLALLLLATSVAPASAHGTGAGGSFAAGVMHPLFGADHVAAMVAVGLWAAIAGGARIWLWPAAFVGAMLLGAVAGSIEMPLAMIEPVIAGSVVVLGLLVASGAKVPGVVGAALVAVFGVFHGHAHGAEAGGASFLPYAAGFAAATVALHLVGIVIGRLVAGADRVWPARGLGLATGAVGIALLVK